MGNLTALDIQSARSTTDWTRRITLCDLPTDLPAWLSSSEVSVYSDLPVQKKMHWLLGRYALKVRVSEYLLGVTRVVLKLSEIEVSSPRGERPAVRILTDTVEPEASNLSISIAHGGGAAIADVVERCDGYEVGVDMEYKRTFAHETVQAFLTRSEYKTFCSFPEERAQEYALRLWCIKEAYLKAKGTGLRVHPRRLEVRREGSGGKYAVIEDGISRAAQVEWTVAGSACMLARVLYPIS